MRPRIYLDHNASTPLDKQVLDAITRQLQEQIGNPSSTHFHGQQSRHILESCRQTIADFLNVKSQEVFFTSGGTEGAFLLLHGIMRKQPRGHIITSNAEHSCVFQTIKQLEEQGYEATFLPTGLLGAVSPEAVKAAIRPDTRMISLIAVNNETGVKTDVDAIAAIAKEVNIPFVVDGVCLVGKESFSLHPGVSAAFFSGHKINAPQGVGFCFCRQSIKLIPMIVGGNQEFNRRAGTENLPGIVGLAEAIKILAKEQAAITAKIKYLRDRLELGIMKLGDVVVNGEGPRVCNTTNLAFLGVDGETLLMNLDREGLSVSHGSACTSGALEPSRILLNMGIPLQQARSSIRFSVGRTTTEAEIDEAIAIVTRVVTKLRHIKTR